MFRNTAAKIELVAYDYSTGALKTGDDANITAYVSKDHGAATVLTDTSATELDATNAKGVYQFDVTATEADADDLLFTAKSSTANVQLVPVRVTTVPGGIASLVGTYERYGIVDSGTAQAASATTLQLRAGSPAFATNNCAGYTLWVKTTNQVYVQCRQVDSNTSGAGGTLTVPAFAVTPTGTISYILFGTAPNSTTTPLAVNITQISGDSAAADNLEAMLDGTGGVALTTTLAGSVSGAVGSVTAGVTVTTNNDKAGYALSSAGNAAVMTEQMAESYAAVGVAPTPAQSLMFIQQFLTAAAAAGVTMTVNKLNGTDIAFTLTLNAAYPVQLPTSIERAT